VIEASGAWEVGWVHLLRRHSARVSKTLLLPVAFLLCSYVCGLATASVGLAVALFVHAPFSHHTVLTHSYLLHAVLLVHALFLTHATLVVHTPLIVHTTPILFPLLLGLLMSLLMRNKCLLMAHGIIATNGTLMHAAEWATDRGIVRMMRMVLSLNWWCLGERRRRWRE